MSKEVNKRKRNRHNKIICFGMLSEKQKANIFEHHAKEAKAATEYVSPAFVSLMSKLKTKSVND